MRNHTLKSCWRHNGTSFILSCLRTVFSELPLHGRWLPAEQLCLYSIAWSARLQKTIHFHCQHHQQGASTFEYGSEHNGNSGGFSASIFYSSNIKILRLWHRKFAWNCYFYYKTPEPKTLYPVFLVENPDAMEAFKTYGLVQIKDLRVIKSLSTCITNWYRSWH